REEEPPKPSTRISTLGKAATTVSTKRQSDPKRLSQLFRGELDWIVMKALEKDRSRRYETASALAADVQRYLHHEPVRVANRVIVGIIVGSATLATSTMGLICSLAGIFTVHWTFWAALLSCSFGLTIASTMEAICGRCEGKTYGQKKG